LVELNILIQNSSKQPKNSLLFDVSTSIRGLHQKKLVLGLLLPVLGAILGGEIIVVIIIIIIIIITIKDIYIAQVRKGQHN